MPSPSLGASGVVGTADIRTLALVGPAAAGKTLLAQALLRASGTIGAASPADRGGTVSDHDRSSAECSTRSTAR
jgi:elongation factor G